MSKAAQIARQYPISSFFALAFGFSWGLWLVFQPLYMAGRPASSGTFGAWAAPLLMLGIFGPALAAITLSAIAGPGRREGTRKAALIAFALAWPAGTLLFTLDQVSGEGREFSLFIGALSAVAALLPAFVLAQSLHSTPGVRRCLETIARPRGALRWHVLALLGFPCLWGLGLLLTRALGMPAPAVRMPQAGTVLQAFFYTLLFTGLSEEPGWRGFALPRLQARLSPLAASLVLGVFWALWHAPARLGGFEARSLADMLVEFVLIILLSILFTWLYNRAGRSILAAMLLHTSMNTATRFMAITIGGLALLALFLAFIVARDRMWEKRA
jgi:membrane protease YdiL (CAAX protease family)